MVYPCTYYVLMHMLNVVSMHVSNNVFMHVLDVIFGSISDGAFMHIQMFYSFIYGFCIHARIRCIHVYIGWCFCAYMDAVFTHLSDGVFMHI